MFEELYAPVPDVEAYLDRIQARRPVELTKDYLDHLIKQHQTMIPFENIDVYVLKKAVQTGTPYLFEKIIKNGRGGFCFEMNALFFAFLKTLGFDVWPCLCKVNEGPGPFYPAAHRGTIARFDDKLYYCDIGFGGPIPAGALELVPDVLQEIEGDTYRMVPTTIAYNEKDWWRLNRISTHTGEGTMLYVNPHPYDPADYLAICHYACCHDQKEFIHFTGNLLLNIRTATGHVSITNRVLKQRINHQVTETQLETADQIKQAMIDLFRLPADIVNQLEIDMDTLPYFEV